eukprot:3797706-Amphidinium_carterae.1
MVRKVLEADVHDMLSHRFGATPVAGARTTRLTCGVVKHTLALLYIALEVGPIRSRAGHWSQHPFRQSVRAFTMLVCTSAPQQLSYKLGSAFGEGARDMP